MIGAYVATIIYTPGYILATSISASYKHQKGVTSSHTPG